MKSSNLRHLKAIVEQIDSLENVTNVKYLLAKYIFLSSYCFLQCENRFSKYSRINLTTCCTLTLCAIRGTRGAKLLRAMPSHFICFGKVSFGFLFRLVAKLFFDFFNNLRRRPVWREKHKKPNRRVCPIRTVQFTQLQSTKTPILFRWWVDKRTRRLPKFQRY